MNRRALVIGAVEASNHPRVSARDMKAVVGKRFSRVQAGSLSYDFFTLNDLTLPVLLFDDPFATQQQNATIRPILNRDEIDERVGLVIGQAGTASMVNETIQLSPQAGECER